MRRCIKKKRQKEGKRKKRPKKMVQLCRADQTSWLQSASVLEANTFPIKTFITALWLEGLFSFFFTSFKCLTKKKKKPPQLSLSSALHFIAYWYSLWTGRWKVPHLHPLFMVINRLSVDPECLNLTQKCLASLICFYSCLRQRCISANTWAERKENNEVCQYGCY